MLFFGIKNLTFSNLGAYFYYKFVFWSQIPAIVNGSSFSVTLDGTSRDDDDNPVAGGLIFEDEKSIRLETKGVSVFIQTDKAIYKPSQTGA